LAPVRTKLGHGIRAGFVLALALSFVACASVPRAGPGREALQLIVLHTNDVHGQVLPRDATWIDPNDPPEVGGLPRVAAAIARIRREESGPGVFVLAVDGGDWFQGTPEGNLDGGLGFVRALSFVGYDAAALGNHEFDLGVAHLCDVLEHAAPPAICANLRDPATDERVDWVEPWRVVEGAGLTLALVGLLTPETPEITHRDARALTFEDPARALGRALEELPAGIDLVIPVGHIDVEEARAVARVHGADGGLPLIVTGHSHTFLREGVREGETLIVQAGSKATALGRVDLWIDARTHEVLDVRAQLIDLLEAPADDPETAAVRGQCAELVARAEQSMGEVVGELAAALTRGSGPRSTVATSWVADLMRAETGADVAAHNRGGTRTELAAGPVTRRDLFELLPFDNHLVTVRLSGAELEAMVRQAVEGTSHSGLDYSGLRVFVRVGESVVLERVEVAGRALDPSASYSVTVNSYIAGGGDSFEMLAEASVRETNPVLLRDLAGRAFEGGRTVEPPGDARIVNVEEAP
jgi:2',3'-cyclic-nucleotide 2'-phosphodiesterase (5'-nucleotidase family)